MLNEERAKDYWQKKNWLKLADISVTLLFLVIMSYSFSGALRRFVNLLTENSIIVITIYSFFFYLFYLIFRLPLNFYSEFYLKHKFHLSEQTSLEWLIHLAQIEGLRFCVFLIIVQGIYFFLITQPQWWWMLIGVITVVFSAVLNNSFRKIILPAFLKKRQLSDERLKDRFKILARRGNIVVNEILISSADIDLVEAQAVLIRIGTSLYLILPLIFLSYAQEEIEIIVAREMAHYHHAHRVKLFIVHMIEIIFSLYLISLLLPRLAAILGIRPNSDIATLPFLCFFFLILTVVFLPFNNALNRRSEKTADNFAIKFINTPEAFVSLMIRLLQQNLTDPQPNRLFKMLLYNHPPIANRIAAAEDYAQELVLKNRPKNV